jgi:hypothetical protein
MLVTLTGAFRNVGDHLIGHRARGLLSHFVDEEIVNLNRKNIQDSDYEIMNRARAVILCGGPAYQRHIYPTIYPIDYKRITVPIIPMGLGWKSHLGDTPEAFEFIPEAKQFITAIHDDIKYSSVRDDLTLSVIENQGIDNVLMTGCPAWYDLTYIEQDFNIPDTVQQINFSTGARYHNELAAILAMLNKRYPKAKKVMTFHHGLWAQMNKNGLYQIFHFLKMIGVGLRYGYSIVDLSKDIEKMAVYDAPNAVHIGYRVHAHLYCLSHRHPSFLINEDVRGAGQAKSLGMAQLMAKDNGLLSDLKKELDQFDNNGKAQFAAIKSKMDKTYKVMQKFLKSIPK